MKAGGGIWKEDGTGLVTLCQQTMIHCRDFNCLLLRNRYYPGVLSAP